MVCALNIIHSVGNQRGAAALAAYASHFCGASQLHLPAAVTVAKKGLAGSCALADNSGQAAGTQTLSPAATSAPGQQVSPSPPSGQPSARITVTFSVAPARNFFHSAVQTSAAINSHRMEWTAVLPAAVSAVRSASTAPLPGAFLRGTAVQSVSKTLAGALGPPSPMAVAPSCRPRSCSACCSWAARSRRAAGGFQPGPSSQYQNSEPGR